MGWIFDGFFFVLVFIIWPLVMLSWGLFLLERRKEVKGASREAEDPGQDEAVR